VGRHLFSHDKICRKLRISIKKFVTKQCGWVVQTKRVLKLNWFHSLGYCCLRQRKCLLRLKANWISFAPRFEEFSRNFCIKAINHNSPYTDQCPENNKKWRLLKKFWKSQFIQGSCKLVYYTRKTIRHTILFEPACQNLLSWVSHSDLFIWCYKATFTDLRNLMRKFSTFPLTCLFCLTVYRSAKLFVTIKVFASWNGSFAIACEKT